MKRFFTLKGFLPPGLEGSRGFQPRSNYVNIVKVGDIE